MLRRTKGFTGRSVGEVGGGDVESEIADRVGCSILHARKIANGSDGDLFAEVDDDGMRQWNIVDGAPEGAFLKVECLVGGMVAVKFLTVGVANGPCLAGNEVAVGVKEIKFGKSDNRRFRTMGGRDFKCDVASGGRSGEIDLLPAVPRIERCREGGGDAVERESLVRLSMVGRSDELEIVDQRLFQPLGDSLPRTEDVKHHDLVLTFAQPASGHIESLLWSDLPDATKRVTVDVDQSFAPSGEIEEGVGRAVDVKCGAIDAHRETPRNGVGGEGINGEILEVIVESGVVGEADDFPVPEIVDEGESIVIDGERDVVSDTLVVLDRPAEVDASHCLHKNVETSSTGNGREADATLAETTIERADETTIDKHLSEIVRLVDGEKSTIG